MIQSHSLDLIIETRDARMPLTSINPAFERLLEQQAGGKFGPNAGVGATKRLIVYNKADLAQECFQEVKSDSSFAVQLSSTDELLRTPRSRYEKLCGRMVSRRSSSPIRELMER
jgi:hypothetical protein